MSRNVIMIAVLVVIAGFFYYRSVENKQINPQDTTLQKIQTDEEYTEVVSEDKILVENLVKDGIIARIEHDSNTPKVYVTADYERIPEVDKNAIMEVLYKYFSASNPEVESFTLYDNKSGDEIGTYKDNQFDEK